MIKLSSGTIINEEASSTLQTDKRALLVYSGNFESMDGPVTITPAHLEVLAKNHNDKLHALGNLVKMSDYPPIQLDHSVSARDTVGRLVGPLELGTHDGLVALFGQVRILGQENWEKVLDGRWTHLSIGADLEKGELQELTITPFPAAKNACLLSKKGDKMSEEKEEEKTKLSEEEEKEEKTELSKEEDEEEKTEMSKEEDEDKTELSKEEEKTKLSEEKEEDEEEKKEKAKLSAAKDELKTALQAFKTQQNSLRLSLRQASIQTRLARLKAQAKVSPAELKKIDLVKLSSSNDATIEAVLNSYENREPVIIPGQYGTVKATSAAEIAKEVKLSNLEAETRANMSFNKKSKTRLASENNEAIATPVTKEKEEVELCNDTVKLWDEIAKAIRSGDEESGKAIFARACKMQVGDVSVDENQMASLMSSFAILENNFSTVVRLASATNGIKL